MEPDVLLALLPPFTQTSSTCTHTDTSYVINYEVFKAMTYTTQYSLFVQTVRPYYHLSKRHYLDSPFTYKKFLTILRQICNYNSIPYTAIMKYAHSISNMEYHLYLIHLNESTNPDPNPNPDPTPDTLST